MALSSVIGQSKSWNLLQKLGEGDAGEVFLVGSVLEGRQAILKKPRKSSFTGEIIRQATQIKNEGNILHSLNGLRPYLSSKNNQLRLNTRVPLLLDQSPVGTEFGDRYFIIMEKAVGLDLSLLTRAAKYGGLDPEQYQAEEKYYLNSLREFGELPDLIILRALASLLQMFEVIHSLKPSNDQLNWGGIIWNDIKTDHIFWDPWSDMITIVDWGNAQFLEADGYTKDRRFSPFNDYAQFFSTFNTYLKEVKPELREYLKWPETILPTHNLAEVIKPFKHKIFEKLNQLRENLENIQKQEADIIDLSSPTPSDLVNLFNIHEAIIHQGGIPDFRLAERFCINLANRLIQEGDLSKFSELSELTCHRYSEKPVKWQVLEKMANLADPENKLVYVGFLKAMNFGLADDWASTLWELLAANLSTFEPPWWDDLCGLIRQAGLGNTPEQLAPLTILRRNILSLQAQLQIMRDRQISLNSPNHQGSDTQNEKSEASSENLTRIKNLETLIKRLRDDIIPKWEELEPNPPDSSLNYSDIERLLAEIQNFDLNIYQQTVRTLAQPRAQVEIILNAWQERDFERARRGLRQLLLWDPDRRRVFIADQALLRTGKWIEKVYQGPAKEQELIDFVTQVEFTGREYRNQVGPADWLDLILDTLANIRKGAKPNELLIERPEIGHDLPWLEQVGDRRYFASQPIQPVRLEREPVILGSDLIFHGIKDGNVGVDQDILLTDPLDTWAPEARGSSARTFNAFISNGNGQIKQVAVKIMREGRHDYALPLYREEVQILNILRDVVGVVPLLECGYIKFDEGMSLPPDNKAISARSLSGVTQRFGPEQAANFLSLLESKAHQGWLPYIAIPKLDNRENLMWLCDTGFTRGRFIPIEQSFRLVLQICDILQIAHERNIVYRDHKLLHYYWSELYNGVFMIDWNVARYHPEGVSLSEIKFDLVQLGARAFHHIFTGRVAPGALKDGPNRVEEVESAAQTYGTQWSYDDQRLPPAIKKILEKLLTAGYSNIQQLKSELYQSYSQLITINEQVK